MYCRSQVYRQDLKLSVIGPVVSILQQPGPPDALQNRLPIIYKECRGRKGLIIDGLFFVCLFDQGPFSPKGPNAHNTSAYEMYHETSRIQQFLFNFALLKFFSIDELSAHWEQV